MMNFKNIIHPEEYSNDVKLYWMSFRKTGIDVNAELFHNVIHNTLDEELFLPKTERTMSEKELDALFDLAEQADALRDWVFCTSTGCACRMPWPVYEMANYVNLWASNHRAEACAEAGRFDLIKYC